MDRTDSTRDAATIPFRDDAEFSTTFPHQVAWGVSWSPTMNWRLAVLAAK